MATPDDQNGGNGKEPRISVSLSTLRREIENAILRLEISLADKFAGREDMTRLEHETREFQRTTQDRFERLENSQEELERDKAGRDAVTNFKKWLTGGAIFGTAFMLIQVGISLWLISHAGGK